MVIESQIMLLYESQVEILKFKILIPTQKLGKRQTQLK